MIESTRIGRSVDREVGLISRLGHESTLGALGVVKHGRVYDLDSTRWHHMPVAPGHPAFQVLTYRSAAGVRNEGDIDWLEKGNAVQLSVISDLVMGTIHTGTHIDGLSHVCCGPNAEWYGGFSAYEHLGDFGPLTCDAITIPPIITRGVLIDVPGYLGEPLLPKGYAITPDEIEGALERQGVTIEANDAVLIRTGYMSVWPDPELAPQHFGAGVNHDAAVLIAEAGAVLAASDTEGFEVHPSTDPDSPLPVHIELLIKRGIHIMELVNLEQLANDGVYEFCFISLALPIRGATGSMTRPIALC